MAKKATRRRGAGGPPLGVSTLSQPENRPVLMQDALADRYLSYALSTIRSRALPDVRDGLKPVHRRILWGMRLLKLYPEDGYKKSARIVGDVMGKYHPHGDSSIYDALVRQAQDFSMRYPLVDGQGNFGNIDGDSAAAMRYTESRLTPFGAAMMEGIDRGAISFRENYDQTDNEPVVMPAAFPNMLANGSLGIAVGMATSIPSFNMAEIFACLRMLLSLKSNERGGDHIAAIAAMMPGPDLATGGVLIEPTDSIIDAYRTGRGGFLVRARWTIDRGERGAWSVLVNEIPYGISKQTLVEAVGTLIENKVLPDIENIIDESAEDLRIRIVPRSKNINPDVMMERLFQKSSFQVRIPLNMNALVKSGEPVVMSIQDMMLEYVEHRRDVLLSMTHYRLHEIADRLEIIAAQRVVFNNLDEVIRIVRDEEHPGPVLQERFSLSDRQVQYVLDTRLRSLRRLEELAMDREDAALRREAQQLGKLLESPARQDKELIRQIDAAEASFAEWEGWGRRTTITSAPQVEVPVEEAPETGGVPTTVACSLQGWMRAARGHGLTDDVFTWRDGDNAGVRAELGSFDRVSFLVSNGRFYNLPVSAFPLKGAGDPIRLAVSGIGPNDNVLSLGTVSDPLLAVSSDGYAIRFNDGATTRKAGKVAMTFPEGESVALVSPVVGTPDSLAIWTGRGRLLVIDMADIPEMQKGRGVRIDRQRPHGILPFVRKEGLPIVVDGGDTQVIKGAALTRYVGKRGQGGMMLPKGFVGFGVLPPA